MQWRPAPGFPGYEVSSHGDVRRVAAGRGVRPNKILKPFVKKSGHRDIVLRRDGVSVHARVGRMVLEAFWGPPPFEGAECCHNDGKPANDHYGNLRWGTKVENFADMIAHGTRRWGEKHHMAKLAPAAIEEIKALAAQGIYQRVIAERFGIAQAQVSRIVNGKRWRDPSSA